MKMEDKCKDRLLSPWPSALAFGLTSGIIYSICAAAVRLWPAGTVRFFGSWFHGIDLTKIYNAQPFGFGTFLIGLISIMLASMVFGALFAVLYNLCFRHCTEKGWIK